MERMRRKDEQNKLQKQYDEARLKKIAELKEQLRVELERWKARKGRGRDPVPVEVAETLEDVDFTSELENVAHDEIDDAEPEEDMTDWANVPNTLEGSDEEGEGEGLF